MKTRWLETLSSEECRELLAPGGLGRVGISIDALPVILPVMYAYKDDAIWFFTEPGTKLAAAAEHAVLAFEIDHVDQVGGWSVLVIGRSRRSLDRGMEQELRATGLVPGAPGVRPELVCIPVQHVSGRSFRHAAQERWELGYL
jgi:uncharacterized protein